MQGRLAQLGGPPEPGMLNTRREVGHGRLAWQQRPGASADLGALRVQKLEGDRQGILAGEAFNLGLEGDQGQVLLLVDLLGDKMHPGQDGPTLANEPDRAPDADRGQIGTEIPAIAKLCLAHQCPPISSQPRHLVQQRQAPGGRSQALNAVMRTVEAKDQRIRASRAELAGHVKNGLAEHIGRAAQFLAIEPDGREGIQALKDQLETLIGLERRRLGRGKFEAIPPFAVAYPGAGQFILVIKGVLNATRCGQCLVDIARRRNVNPLIIHDEALGKHSQGSPFSWRKIFKLPVIEHCSLLLHRCLLLRAGMPLPSERTASCAQELNRLSTGQHSSTSLT